MRIHSRRVIATLAVIGCAACAHTEGPTRRGSWEQERAAARPAAAALQAGDFAGASAAAEVALQADAGNPQARLVRAVSGYFAAMHELFTEVRGFFEEFDREQRVDEQRGRAALDKAERALAQVDADLAAAEAEPDLSLELCLACWQRDWNMNGRIDSRDERLLEIEYDGDGHALPEDDPRRKPTFRFDAGDVAWARAAVAFQRAALDVLLAYRWYELWANLIRKSTMLIHIPLVEKGRIAQARKLILEGLDQADRARALYLAETDDDREWVPNPRQKSHPMPLTVDDAVYATWRDVAGDLRRLVAGKEGLSLAELAELAEHRWRDPPRGFLDVGRLLAEPRDIDINVAAIAVRAQMLSRRGQTEAFLADVLGEGYRDSMPRSPLIDRLRRMKSEVDRGDETFERKLRYLFWLN
jgi:hypothetical protein